MVLKIDHIGVAVENLQKALQFYSGLMGLRSGGTEEVAEQKVKVAFIPVGESEIELLEPTSPDGPIARFITSRGPGIQHIAFRVADIEKALKELKAQGVRLIDEKPRCGARGARIAFLHPKETQGVLVELCESGKSGG
jgi:methylmalonyl-CoA/ethylmalonyl-CoA epimerase